MTDLDFPTPGMIPMEHLNEQVWYSYLHVDGSVHTKRYFNWADYKEVGDSDFCQYVTLLYCKNNVLSAQAEGIRLVRAHA